MQFPTHLYRLAALLLILAALLAACSSEPPVVTEGTPNELDGGDGLTTTGGGTMTFGASAERILDSSSQAHNWAFEGSTGQGVTIIVEGIEGGDPRLHLLNPDGEVIADADDTGADEGYQDTDAYLRTILPEAGTYTIRVDMYVPGMYRLTLRS